MLCKICHRDIQFARRTLVSDFGSIRFTDYDNFGKQLCMIFLYVASTHF